MLFAQQVTTSSSRTCVRSSDTIKCWGAALFHGAHLGTLLQNPKRLTFQDQEIKYVRLSEKKICVITEDGSLYCWGDGIVGYGSEEKKFKPDPKPINFQGKKVNHVAFSPLVACAILEDGSLHCWGDRNLNGYNDGLSRLAPDSVPVDFRGKKVKQIAISFFDGCALLENRKVY
ncbi:MAG: hypothetical protein AAGJ35_14320, partial [Myxococcota bacterium]